MAVNGPAVTDLLRVVTGAPDLLWSGSRALAHRPDTDEMFFSDLNYGFDQLALFGEPSVALTDRLSLTGGLRWYDLEEARTQVFAGLFADPLDSEGTTTATGVATRIIASYDVTAATHLNPQVSKGFRLGGINEPLNTPILLSGGSGDVRRLRHLGGRGAVKLRGGRQVDLPRWPPHAQRVRLLQASTWTSAT